MIVVGHSLGGDMLASGLEADLLKSVRRHKRDKLLPPVLGNLVVLVNPAAEATKWTSIQRAVWDRTAVFTGPDTPASDVIADNDIFPVRQKPVVVSITAREFPPGGLRPGDCAWINLDIDDRFKAARELIRRRLAKTDKTLDSGIEYDWATHDLFPTFKFDFRPAAAYLDRVASRIEGRPPQGASCLQPHAASLLARIEAAPIQGWPFSPALSPSRPRTPKRHTRSAISIRRDRSAACLPTRSPRPRPFGTTHELIGYDTLGREPHHPYATLADAELDCPLSNRWIYRARRAHATQYGLFWDSDVLGPPEPGVPGQGKPAARYLDGLGLSGMAPITRADDPFWNVRAFDNELSRHDGYRLSSFICAISQLVLDDTTGADLGIVDHIDDPDRPTIEAGRSCELGRFGRSRSRTF